MYKIYATTVLLVCWLQPIVILAQASEQTIDLNARCELLEDLKIKDTHILSASVVTDDSDLPKYCLVTGYVLPAVNFEIRLPIEQWNGKFYMTGCGGFCGSVNSDSKNFYLGMNYGLKRNYAVSTMDAGHWGESFSDGRWALNNRIAEIDWAYRAVHETARVSKLVIETFYGREPEKSFFNGCSTGGRMAVMEALRYPEDFDGIISGAPAIDYTGLVAVYFTWMVRANLGPDGKVIVSSDDLKLIAEAVYSACDEVDGLKDGLIETPYDCEFELEDLLCDDLQKQNCLTRRQVETVKAWYEGAKNSVSKQLYLGGFPLGSEPFWQRWITGQTEEASDNSFTQLSTNFLRYMAFQEDPGDSYNITDFNFDLDPQRLEYMAGIYNSDDPDLELYRKNGGKLLMYHGWADAAVPPWTSIEYYEAVEHNLGSREETQEFFRLYMIPGMGHCGLSGGPGITDGGVDLLTALELWVEMGESPQSLLTTKYDDDGTVLWTRPVCPYPQRAIYTGQGDIHDAANYSCGEP
jgi:pimeloyl-ACP methyl ester carboxylesterase